MSESGSGSSGSPVKAKNFCCRLRARTWIQIIVIYQILICGTMLTLGGTRVTQTLMEKWMNMEPLEMDNSIDRYEHYANVYPFTVFRFKPSNESEIRLHHQKKQEQLKSKEDMKIVSDVFLVVFSIELVMAFVLQFGKHKGSPIMLYIWSGWSGLGLTILFVVCQSYGALFIPVACFLVVLFLADIFCACAVYSHAKELSKRQHDHHHQLHQSTDLKYKVRRLRHIRKITYVHQFNGNKL